MTSESSRSKDPPSLFSMTRPEARKSHLCPDPRPKTTVPLVHTCDHTHLNVVNITGVGGVDISLRSTIVNKVVFEVLGCNRPHLLVTWRFVQFDHRFPQYVTLQSAHFCKGKH